MKLPFPLAILMLLTVFLPPSVRAQEAAVPQQQDKGTVAGTVIDAVTEQPLKGAEIRLRNIPGAASASQPAAQSIPQPTSTNTDASGHFQFENVSPGRYVLLAFHDGYVNNNRAYADLRGRSLSVAPGQHLTDIVVRLLPNGTIAGHITNEAGKPLRGIEVEAMKSSYLHGRRELHQVAQAPTNDAGDYRIPALVPGKYYIRAKPPASLKAKSADDKAYVPLYYPAATEQTRSVPLVVRAGEDLAGIDFNLVPVHTVHIRGRVINARSSLPSKEASITLLSDQGETIFSVGSPSQNVSASSQGTFDFQGVPPGSYVLVAQQPSDPQEQKTMWGMTSIEVKDTNLEHVDVVVGTGVDVSGRIRVDGDTVPDVNNLMGNLDPLEPSSLANLTPDIDNATVKPDGTFVFKEVPEGDYRINFFPVPTGFYLRSTGSTDVLETGIAVSRGHSPSPVELVLSPGAGRIDGTVQSDEQSAPGASVVLVPEGKWRGQPNYYRQAVSDMLGRFALRNIVPGDYTVFAWEQVDRGAYFDPEFLARYEDRGKAVHIEEGGQISVKLEEIPAAESVP